MMVGVLVVGLPVLSEIQSEEQGILDSNAIFGGPLRENQWQQILFGGAEIEEDIFLEVLDVLDTRTLRDSHEDILLFRSLELFIEYGSFKVKLGAYVRDSVERVLTQRVLFFLAVSLFLLFLFSSSCYIIICRFDS